MNKINGSTKLTTSGSTRPTINPERSRRIKLLAWLVGSHDPNQRANSFAAVLLIVMFLLLVGSIWNNSGTMDELAHIPSGYSYITEQDYRLNPEHPPLLKSLAGLSAKLFVNPNFPTDTKFWQDDLNGQWDQGRAFLYQSGNDADKLIFWSRFPFILLAVLFGGLLFAWVKKRFSTPTALITLILFAFSPTFLAHSPLVTTDLGAAFGFFIGIIAFVKFLEVPTWRNILLAGLALGLALLLKFSTILLLPTFGVLLIALPLVTPHLHMHERFRVFFRMLGKTVVVGLVALILIWAVYAYHVWNYPQERQLADARANLTTYGYRPAVNFDLALIENKYTRPLGQYLLGTLMVIQRAAGGNTAFFLGDTTNVGSRLYFPLLYLLKEPLAFHILALIALWFAAKKIIRRKLSFDKQKLSLVRKWIYEHQAEFASIVFIIIYWAASLRSPLNIGVRHVLPTFPFIYLLVSRQIVDWIHFHELSDPQTWLGWLKNIYQMYIRAIPKFLLVLFLLVWLVLNTVTIFPHFLAYYNELAGGTSNGYKIAVDSNYDWGQDLKRLTEYVEENGIQKIAIDYFGAGSPEYYLGDKFDPWWSARGPASGWFAISASTRQGAFGTPTKGWTRNPEDSYEWLREYEPVARVGYSIFVYKLP